MIAAPIDGLTLKNLKETWKREIQQKIKTAIPTGHEARVIVGGLHMCAGLRYSHLLEKRFNEKFYRCRSEYIIETKP